MEQVGVLSNVKRAELVSFTSYMEDSARFGPLTRILFCTGEMHKPRLQHIQYLPVHDINHFGHKSDVLVEDLSAFIRFPT